MPVVRVLENYLMNTRYFCDRVTDISLTLPATLLCSFSIPVVKVLGGHLRDFGFTGPVRRCFSWAVNSPLFIWWLSEGGR